MFGKLELDLVIMPGFFSLDPSTFPGSFWELTGLAAILGRMRSLDYAYHSHQNDYEQPPYISNVFPFIGHVLSLARGKKASLTELL